MKRKAKAVVIIAVVAAVVGGYVVGMGVVPRQGHRVGLPFVAVGWRPLGTFVPTPTAPPTQTPTRLPSPSCRPCEYYQTSTPVPPQRCPTCTPTGPTPTRAGAAQGQEEAQSGVAAYYAPSWDWERIARRNGVAIPGGVVPVAHWDCRKLGWEGELLFPRSGHGYEVVVADCTEEGDLALVLERGIVVEVPYWVAEAEGFVRAGKAPAVLVMWPQR